MDHRFVFMTDEPRLFMTSEPFHSNFTTFNQLSVHVVADKPFNIIEEKELLKLNDTGKL